MDKAVITFIDPGRMAAIPTFGVIRGIADKGVYFLLKLT
jgi:hypothetical protein